MKGKWSRRALVVMMSLLIAFIAVVTLMNLRLLVKPTSDFLRGQIGFSQFVSGIQQNYTQSIRGKRRFITLNGWFAGALDQTICNNTVKLKNGMLTDVCTKVDTAAYAENAGEFKGFLADRGIKFLYVQAPSKVDLNNTLLPDGIEDYSNENANALLSQMEGLGIRTLDLRQKLVATAEMSGQYFFRTDLHWNMKGAFLAFQNIASELKELFPEKNLDISYANPDKWQVHEKENLFLGYPGRRVGQYFTGVDDAVYFTPAFDTDMSCAVMNHARLYKGSFDDAIVRSYAFERVNYFDSSFYSIYVGDNTALVQHRNPLAPNDLRILMIRDSFGRPVQSFLSTMFREIDVIDPRNYRADIGQYIDFFQPDIVIEILYTHSIESSAYDYFHYVLGDGSEATHSIVLGPTDVEIPPGSEYTSIPVTLEAGAYMLRFDDVEFTADESDGIAAGLFSANTGEACETAAFNVDYARANGGFVQFLFVPESKGGELELRLFAGDANAPSDHGAVYRRVVLESIR